MTACGILGQSCRIAPKPNMFRPAQQTHHKPLALVDVAFSQHMAHTMNMAMSQVAPLHMCPEGGSLPVTAKSNRRATSSPTLEFVAPNVGNNIFLVGTVAASYTSVFACTCGASVQLKLVFGACPPISMPATRRVS